MTSFEQGIQEKLESGETVYIALPKECVVEGILWARTHLKSIFREETEDENGKEITVMQKEAKEQKRKIDQLKLEASQQIQTEEAAQKNQGSNEVEDEEEKEGAEEDKENSRDNQNDGFGGQSKRLRSDPSANKAQGAKATLTRRVTRTRRTGE